MEDKDQRRNWKDLYPTPIYTLASFEFPLPREDRYKTYYVLKSKNWVNVVPVDKQGNILLINQYRHGIGAISLEIPGGIVDEVGEGMELESALRELREETGFGTSLDKVELLCRFSGNPAMFTNWSYSYVAYDVEPLFAVEWDEGEEIELVWKTEREVRSLLVSGQIHHPHMAAALGVYFLRRDQS